MSTMIALVGEQPIPVLLPVRALKPNLVALMHTGDTRLVAERIKRLINTQVDLLEVEPFDVRDCQRVLKRYLKHAPGPVIYNLTGGTKTMLLAAYMVALTNRSSVVYLQTQGATSRLYSYRVGSSGLVEIEARELPALINADDYLKAHLPGFTLDGFSREGKSLTSGGLFEKAVHDALLRGRIDEVLPGVKPDGVAKNIDIDLFVRCGNQAGIAEIKLNKAGKAGLDQLATAGGREYLGIYTAKFLIVGNIIGDGLKELAQARGIKIIELPSYAINKQLSLVDEKVLTESVRGKLGVKPT